MESETQAGWTPVAVPALWWVIQNYNADTYPDPTAIPALVRRARRPGVAEPWVQPIDQFDAYRLVDPFTGQPETCTHNGKTWRAKVAHTTHAGWAPSAATHAVWTEQPE